MKITRSIIFFSGAFPIGNAASNAYNDNDAAAVVAVCLTLLWPNKNKIRRITDFGGCPLSRCGRQ